MKCLLLFLFLCTVTVHSFRRELTMEKTPDCEKYDIPLYYTKASGPNDTLHYIWDFFSKPTAFVALTKNENRISFNWTEFVAGKKSVSFDNPPEYTFALVFNKIIEFNDIMDEGLLTPDTLNISYDTSHFQWLPTPYINQTVSGDSVSVNFEGRSIHDSPLNGTVSIQLEAYGYDGHALLQPRLMHSPNTTQCRVILNNLHSNSGFNSSRFALELILFSSDSTNSSSKIFTRMNFDDENTPGIFSIVDLMTPQSQDNLYKGVFLQWRPVAFIDEIPSLVNSTEVITYNLTRNNAFEDELENTLVYKLYGPEYNDYLIQQTAISMGMTEDGFYKKTNYSSWTFTINYGSPQAEKFSLLVILVMAIGLGFPIALILIGGSYMISRRMRKKRELDLTR